MHMATRKKAKTKRPSKPAKKPIARKKAPPAKKAPAKKSPPLRVAAKKKAKKQAPRPLRAPKVKPAAPAVVPAPMAGEERIGSVTHYYGELSVAAVRIESGSLRLGDTIHVVGHTSDFRQRVESMQIEHEPAAEVRAGQEIGLKVTAHAREHDAVYKVTST